VGEATSEAENTLCQGLGERDWKGDEYVSLPAKFRDGLLGIKRTKPLKRET
jgi:hypothetical protein